MRTFTKLTTVSTLFNLLICSAASASYNKNPASIGLVEELIQQAAYTAGPGILISRDHCD